MKETAAKGLDNSKNAADMKRLQDKLNKDVRLTMTSSQNFSPRRV